MVCSTLIKDEKQQQSSTHKQSGMVLLLLMPRTHSDSGLPVPEDTAGIQSRKSHALLETPGAPCSSSIMLQANISWRRDSFPPAPKITAVVGEVHPRWCILAQVYKKAQLLLLPITQNIVDRVLHEHQGWRSLQFLRLHPVVGFPPVRESTIPARRFSGHSGHLQRQPGHPPLSSHPSKGCLSLPLKFLVLTHHHSSCQIPC